MNEPHIPRNSRDWDSIDIFVFSNGQQYSPPRKYHLESDDLKWWDATKSYLAKSQYGSEHSAIDLYLLDGKIIEGPLELKNSAAYVAVEPHDTFIPAGYEKYLFKASSYVFHRSWEKRQGKLSNSYTVERTDKKGTFLDITTIEQIERIVSLKSNSSIPEPTKTINQPQRTVEKPNASKLNSAKIDKIFQKKKSSDNERSSSLNKKHLSPSKLNKNDFVKTKNILKPQKCGNKQKPLSPQYSRSQRKPFRNRVECKADPKRNNLQVLEIVSNSKLEPNVLNNTNVIKTNIENVPDKDLLKGSQVYKNNESDDKSVLLEANPNKLTFDGNSTKNIFVVSKDNEFNNTLTPNVLKMDNVTSKHITDETVDKLSPDNNKQKLNIKLRIKFEDLKSSMTSEDGNNLEKDRSLVTLIKKEMASQVNIDVILGKDILKLNHYLFLNEKSKESNEKKHEEYTPSNDDVKEIFVHCTYDNFYPKLCPLNDSCRKNMLILPTEMNEYLLKSCCKCNQEKIEMVNKGIQKSNSSDGGLNLAKTDHDKVENITKHKVAILKEISIENKSKLQTELQDDVITVEKNVPLLLSKVFDDKCTQTEWCNIVLQAKIHEEGRYSFHLPALSLLKQYNIDQM